ncbi:hypothetical protein GCM10017710_05450 [Arthrobacter ramosus]
MGRALLRARDLFGQLKRHLFGLVEEPHLAMHRHQGKPLLGLSVADGAAVMQVQAERAAVDLRSPVVQQLEGATRDPGPVCLGSDLLRIAGQCLIKSGLLLVQITCELRGIFTHPQSLSERAT